MGERGEVKLQLRTYGYGYAPGSRFGFSVLVGDVADSLATSAFASPQT